MYARASRVSHHKDYYQLETLLSRVINDAARGRTPNIQMTFLSAAPFGRKDFDGSRGRRIRIGREEEWSGVPVLKKTLGHIHRDTPGFTHFSRGIAGQFLRSTTNPELRSIAKYISRFS